MKNHIIVDSGCDIIRDLVEAEDTAYSRVPLNLELDGTTYIDDDNLDMDAYINHMESSKNAVKSSAPSPGAFLENFKLGENVFAVSLSSKLSATYQSAMTAKDMYIEDFGNKFIHIFDSLNAAIGEGLVALKISELLKKGRAAADVVTNVQDYISGLQTYFIINKFDLLVKTGRINPYVAKIAGLLNVKPICGNEDGEIKLVSKARGTTGAIKKLVTIIKEKTPDIEERIVGITHVKAYEKAVELKNEVLNHLRPRDIIITEGHGITTTYATRGGLVVSV
jgi:DegV family protein with EDD domain